MNEKFYLTTPIYFPSDKLHIGHAYCSVATDTLARYKKLRGYDVMFLTGTDEHGQKIEGIAKEKNVSPKEYVDEIVEWIKELWVIMDVNYDIFIRTTDESHQKAIQKIFKKLYDSGDIYKSYYEGLYCTPCETFFTEIQLKGGKCPDCGRDVEKVKEESYFFRLSKYQDQIIEHIEKNDDFIQPKTRQHEMLNNFLKPGLTDLAVSRKSFKWGIPVDFDPGHIVYVWVDALANYITALGYLSDNNSLYKKYWPADVHIVGKEIVRFHTIIWPAMLLALGEPLPKQVFGHGWIVLDGGKMSKSKGNVVDPKTLVDRYGVDAVRYFLMREVAFGHDGNFSNEALIQRINSDLANDIGNLVSRTVGMVEKYFAGKNPEKHEPTFYDDEIIKLANETVSKVESQMDKYLFSDALASIWVLVSRLNKYIDETMPWVLAKNEERRAELANVMYTLAEGIRIVSILISPVMTRTPKEIYRQFNIYNEEITTWDSAKKWGLMEKEFSVTKSSVIFPRIDMEKELLELQDALNEAQKETTYSELNKSDTESEEPESKETESEDGVKKEFITIDEFSKTEFKIGEIIECEAVKKSKKLLKSQVKIGNEVRQILSGISNQYSPDQMIGKKVVVVTNLKPAKLAGVISEGMILAAEDSEGNLSLVTIDRDIISGSEVK